ncbi:S41 family peptidase [Actinacidiphila acididurans]|uniref:PDZ domain-containing protein n=1 Tax=Actinacidiphila acididurans TaxID=2784346 RepID=A0ABS2U2T7_9ACTN|nr:S41 family peptidase [Actinacidiphila acididurans]MBM9508850.1 PDZ domain-containing protein [Actinacidiphila acididurans]
MSGPSLFGTPRRIRRGATLTLVFGTMLATGAAAGSFAEPAGGQRSHGGTSARIATVADAAGARRIAPRATAPGSGTGKPADSGTGTGTDGGADTGTDSSSGGDDGRAAADTARIAAEIASGTVGPQVVEKLVSRSGDRWSSFYTAQEYAGLQQALDGRYVGVGLWVRRIDGGRIQVARVQQGSPAGRAGVQVGDVIAAIGATHCTGLAVTEVVADLRGDNQPGSTVTLAMERGRSAWSVTLRRATLATEAVTVTRETDGPTVVKIDAFTRGVGAQVRQAVRGARHGVLLDLRGNSGGLVTEAVAVASAFLDGGLVATYDVDGRQHALYAAGGGDTGTPLVVLVDGGTMSAAEMLAGALQDRGRAVVMGSRTFGKGTVQMPSALPDGSVAELTVGHYTLPDGREVDGKGITPDVQVPGDQDPVADSREVFAGLGAAS